MLVNKCHHILINILSNYQHGLTKNHSVQHCLLAPMPKWKGSVDQGKVFGLLLTGLFKAFDCLPHDLFPARMQFYGFNIKELRLIKN